jgi:hypothetical protein
MKRVVVAAGIVLCAVPASGCKHSSPKSFRARALEICARYRGQQKQLDISRDAELRKAITLMGAEVRDLRPLRPPPSQSATYRRWLGALDGLVAVLERERVVLNRDEARLDAALRREKVPTSKLKKLTSAELMHPTELVLSQTLAPLPEWHAFVRDTNTIARESKGLVHQVVRLAKQLQLQDCLR